MTRAVCIQCGAFKVGAWTPCPSCGFDPSGKGLEAEARALYLTDHHRDADQLRLASDAIREGRPPDVEPAFVAQLVAEAAASGQTSLVPAVPALFRGCGVGLIAVLLVLVAWVLVSLR